MNDDSLLDLFEEGARGTGRLVFLPSREAVSVDALWSQSASAARWLRRRAPEGRPLAMVLEASPGCIRTLLGALRLGRSVLSVPLPARGGSIDRYAALVVGILDGMQAELVLAEPSRLPLLDGFGLDVAPVGETSEGGPLPEDGEAATLIQFSSGTTGDPRGIVLGQAAVAANLRAILERLDPQPGDGVCSWLPLSHDMGLIGTLFTALAAAAPAYAGGGEVVLIRPEDFVRRPSLWMDTCSEFGSTITAGPDFGLSLATRARAATGLDLSHLRALLVGAEPIRPNSLRSFTEHFAGSGFRDDAFCPAYGLAEASLAVTLCPPSQRWRSIVVDDVRLGEGEVVPLGPAAGSARTAELVSCGPPLDGYELRTDADETARAGVLSVAGPSLLREYLGEGSPVCDGWLPTSDLAFVDGGELFVVGRIDDIVCVAGRNVNLAAIDHVLEVERTCAKGTAVSYALGPDFGVAAEWVEQRDPAPVRYAEAIRQQVVREFGLAPARITILAKGKLVKTPSGKPKRSEVARLVWVGGLDPVHDVEIREPNR